MDEALSRLEHFIMNASARGHQAVLVITGKGMNSPEGPVLQGAVKEWLRTRGKGSIAEFHPAPRDKGGGGAIAFAYVAGKKGDPHVWLTATTSFLTTPLLGKSKYTYKDFTPLANLAYDDFFVTVKADSPYKTMKDLIDDAKKRPGQIKTGGTYAPGTDALISHMIEKAAGVKFNYIPFKRRGEAMIALLGGNLDMFYPNPGEALAQLEAKKVRILAVASEKRLAAVQKKLQILDRDQPNVAQHVTSLPLRGAHGAYREGKVRCRLQEMPRMQSPMPRDRIASIQYPSAFDR
jgi:hypothetical protein